MTTETSDGIVTLDTETCWRLLTQEEVGRLAVSVGRHPDVFPLNYIVDGDTLVFRTAEGAKLAALAVGPAVAFEIDGYDAAAGEAWSVVVKGQAHEIDMHDRLDDAFPVFPWSATSKSRFIRIVPEQVTGRRFHVVQRRP
jgi:nitroimidazol reductase NimA-like FMN-containing flavoprotein (pyridoxamine 5'-phosphate oxidase superfamily)